MTLPMFPLGGVLMPTAALPLHVFEPRYRQLVHDCLEGEPEFGVVLIERGSEVGGGDVRTDVGTVARIIEAAELPDGRWALATVGTRRIRVREWLADDPYPRAEIEDWPDTEPAADLGVAVDAVAALLRRALAMHVELGDMPGSTTVELDEDPTLGGYQACALAPLGSFDKQVLLTAATPAERVATLHRLLEDDIATMDARLQRPG